MNKIEYYARNEKEKEFDDCIRNAVYENGTKVEMALYVQNQEILNLLRRIEDSLNK